MKGKKLQTLEEDLEEEEVEMLESELEGQQEAEPELEAQFESEPQELSPRSKDKKKDKVGQESGLSALALGRSVPPAEFTCGGTRASPGAKCPFPPVKEV